MLIFDIVPERSLSTGKWEFVLGMPVAQAVAIIQREVRHIPKCEIAFCDDDNDNDGGALNVNNENHNDLLLHLIEQDVVPTRSHVEACFGATRPPHYDAAQGCFVLGYRGISFFIPAYSAGVNVDGDADEMLAHRNNDSRTRSSPYYFHQQNRHNNSIHHHQRSSQHSPVRSAAVRSLCIYSGSSLQDARAPASMPITCYNNRAYADSIDVVRDGSRTVGVQIHLTCENGSAITSAAAAQQQQQHQAALFASPSPSKERTAYSANSTPQQQQNRQSFPLPTILDSDHISDRLHAVRNVRFGDSVQDVLTSLGAPEKVFFKSEDKMRIHLPRMYKTGINIGGISSGGMRGGGAVGSSFGVDAERSDFFFNYFTFGLDILFDAEMYTVKKFVLHSNMPGHYDFNVYYRAQFKIPIFAQQQQHERYSRTAADSTDLKTISPPVMPHNDSSLMSAVNDSRDDHHHNNKILQHSEQVVMDQPEPYMVSVFTKWDDVQQYVNTSQSRPIVLHRNTSLNTPNPFGETYCYGFQDIIFEVMSNGYISSVTLHDVNV